MAQYYVSTSGSGTGVGSQGDPWTPAQLNANQSTLVSNVDTVFLKRGDTYDGTLTLSKSGIKYRAYGTGARFTIRGSDSLSGSTWTLDDGTTYYTTLETAPGAVFLDDVEQEEAKTAEIVITNRTANNQLSADSTTLGNLNTTESLVGARIVSRMFIFMPSQDNVYVTNYSSGTLTFDRQLGLYNANTPGNNYAPAINREFRLFGLKSFIANTGDWAYNAAEDRLYFKTASGSPEGTNIRIATRDYGIVIEDGVENVDIKDIKFTHQRVAGVLSQNNSGLKVRYCNFANIHYHGITLIGNTDGFYVDGNAFLTLYGNAINVGGVRNGYIRNNYIRNIGLTRLIGYDFVNPDMPANRFPMLGWGCGIQCFWDHTATVSVPQNVTFSRNDINQTGYCNILFTGIGLVFEENKLSNPLALWEDGGAIRCVHRAFATGADTRNCIIRGNQITATNDASIIGIYIDAGCTGITIEENHVEGYSQIQCYLNRDTDEHIIRNNTFVGKINNDATVVFREQNSNFYTNSLMGPVSMTHTTSRTMQFYGNKIVSRHSSVPCVQTVNLDGVTTYSPFADGLSNDNIFIAPYTANVTKYNDTSETLAQFKTRHGTDADSIELSDIKSYTNEANAIIDAQSVINDKFIEIDYSVGTNYTDEEGVDVSSTVRTIPAFGSIVNVKAS